jgi:formylglycine-generating enzyme required for sulfatase activity
VTATIVVFSWLLSAGCLVGLDTSVPVSGEADDALDVEPDGDGMDEGDGAPEADAADPPDTDGSDVEVDATPDTDVVVPPDADADADADTDAVDDADVTPALRCADLDCDAQGRQCDEGDDTTDARCGQCLSEFVEEGESCVAAGPRDLGASCSADSQCPAGSWCSTVSGLRRCSPRLFSGQSAQMDFVFVPSGTFTQGTPGSTGPDRPYSATLTRSFFVSRTEVTQAQWKAATGGTNPSYFQNLTCTNGDCTSTENANNSGPVEQVDWYATLAYANWLSSQNGLQECYTFNGCDGASTDWHDGAYDGCTDATFVGLDCTGYRMLTESEWERAARGGTTTPYFWGESTDTSTLGQNAWFNANSGGRTQSVGQKLANPYGLFDTSGNVWEWVWDWAFTADDWIPYPTDSATDYLGGSAGAFRCFRGGSWVNNATTLGSAYREIDDPASRNNSYGLRLARTVP